MKTNIVLIFIVLLTIGLLLGGAVLWHLSNFAEFTRADTPVQSSQ